MSHTCAFCGAVGTITAEHILPAWLGAIGLPNEAVCHATGRLNRSLDERGVSPPFNRTVRDACAGCNNGWLSGLEDSAKQVLAGPILGRDAVFDPTSSAVAARWLHKTALVSMLATTDASEVRSNALGVDMRAIYAARRQQVPLVQAVWIGQYVGTERLSAVCLTPMVARVVGLAPSDDIVEDLPNAYVMTLVVGELLLHGIRFTTPMFAFDVVPSTALTQLWPGGRTVRWPCPGAVDDEQLAALEGGRHLRPFDPRFALAPWRPATDLPDQEVDGEWMRLATPCGEHFARYPRPLAVAALAGHSSAFVLGCSCPRRYLVVTHATGVRVKCESGGEDRERDLVRAVYDRLGGVDDVLDGVFGEFRFKRLVGRFKT